MTAPARLLAGALLLVALTGCSLRGGVYELPLPGGADVGDSPQTVIAEFTDVLDLVPHSSVQVGNVDVGYVERIELTEDGRAAQVTMKVRSDLGLTADTTARVQQTSLLGEKYVALVSGTAADPLPDNARLPVGSTSRAVGSEEVLGALSALLNGGGVGQFQEISREMQAIGEGRTDEIRQFLRDSEAMARELDANRQGVVAAIDGLDRLSTELAQNRGHIESVLDGLGPGLQELVAQRAELTRLLASLDRLGAVTVDTLDEAGDDIVSSLAALSPVLDKLAASGQNLPRSLGMMLTFPFTDAVLAAVKGDYLNAFVTMRLAVTSGSGPLPQPEEGR